MDHRGEAGRAPADDFESYQLGFKMVGGEVFRFFTDLGPGGKNTYFETPYKAEGRSVVASFPLSDLSGASRPVRVVRRLDLRRERCRPVSGGGQGGVHALTPPPDQ